MSKDLNITTIDKARIAHSFSQAAPNYDVNAVLQQEVGQRLLTRLAWIKTTPRLILDLGAGTGELSRHLEKHYKHAHIITLDIASGMLNIAQKRKKWFSRQQCVCADLEHLPFKPHSVDIIFSNLAFQWSGQQSTLFRQCLDVLKPGGVLLFSTLGPDTLQELRMSWQHIDDQPHVNTFLDMHDIGDNVLAAGFVHPVVDRDILTLTYPSVKALMQELKATGANQLTAERSKGVTGKKAFSKVINAYEQFKTETNQYPATYEIIYGLAFKAEFNQSHDRSGQKTTYIDPNHIPVRQSLPK